MDNAIRKISKLLYQQDIVDLAAKGNEDEYDSEAKMIYEALPKIQTVEELQIKIHAIFKDMFEGVDVGQAESYKPLASAIFNQFKTKS